MGWYAMALVDVLDDFPEDHPDHAALVDLFQSYAEAVVNVQDPVTRRLVPGPRQAEPRGQLPGGLRLGHVHLRAAEGRPEGLARPRRTLPRAGRAPTTASSASSCAWATTGSPSLTQVVSVGGLGGDNDRDGTFEYYLSEPVQSPTTPKGIGPFILASLEIERLGLSTP